MRLRAALAATVGGALALAAGLVGAANAEAICTHDLRVLAQPRDGLTLLEKYKDEFKALSGASFNIDYLNENDRRAKSRADASTVGKYNVYYIDEANIALFASSKWVVPLLDYYPKEFDFARLRSRPAESRHLRRQSLFRAADRRRRSDGLSQGPSGEGWNSGAEDARRDDRRGEEAKRS